MKLESLGCGVTRAHKPNVGFADLSASYDAKRDTWTVQVVRTNIIDEAALDNVIADYRRIEGMN